MIIDWEVDGKRMLGYSTNKAHDDGEPTYIIGEFKLQCLSEKYRIGGMVVSYNALPALPMASIGDAKACAELIELGRL